MLKSSCCIFRVLHLTQRSLEAIELRRLSLFFKGKRIAGVLRHCIFWKVALIRDYTVASYVASKANAWT